MRKAIIDSCFINKFKDGTDLVDDFFKLMRELNIELFMHPYIAEYELDMFPYIDKLIEQGVFSVISYEVFLPNELYKTMYQSLYIEIYNEFVDRMELINPRKAELMKKLDADTNVFRTRYSKSSMGDVHMIMLALYEDIPIILSEDNKDLWEAYNIAKPKIEREGYMLNIFKISDVIDILDNDSNCSISHKELKRMRRHFGR